MRPNSFIVVVLVVVTAGCATETTTCDGIMFGGECHPCPGKMLEGVCLTGPLDVVEAECSSDADCLPLAACIAGKCDKECTQDANCPAGEECVLYRCIGETRAADIPPDILPENCNPTDGPYGAACNCKQECATALCVQNKITNSNVCTQFCQNDAQCPGPDVCIPVDQTSVCILNDSGQATSCNPDEAYCYKGVYLTNKLGKCACTTPCTKAVDCPEGFACHVLGADKACVSTGETCGANYNPCFGQCAGDPNSGVGFCTGICITSADCPSGWTCQPIADGVSVCASPF